LWEKRHPHAERSRQFDARFLSAFPEETLREGQQESRAVAAEAIRIHTTPMREPPQCRQGALDHFAGALAAQLRDEANATRIVVDFRTRGKGPHSIYLPRAAAISTIENFDAGNAFFERGNSRRRH
jgi:hypothetical protein